MSIVTVLIEDSSTIREALIPTMRELADLEVVAVADTAVDAIQTLSMHAWQLVVVDLFLKKGSGLEVLRHCTNRSPDQHMVVLTNYATPDIRQKCLALGATAVFDKSTELDDFFGFCSELFTNG
ncbi:response regulator [Variovorax sp. HJSM1_2]|uniref:response regulator n=1 Tax=Variovorax sp. HJSM1_2 TaxID=3366263 RepID=UPI003BCF8E2C